MLASQLCQRPVIKPVRARSSHLMAGTIVNVASSRCLANSNHTPSADIFSIQDWSAQRHRPLGYYMCRASSDAAEQGTSPEVQPGPVEVDASAVEMVAPEDMDPEMQKLSETLDKYVQLLQTGEGAVVSDEQLANLLTTVPDIFEKDPQQVKAFLDTLCAGTGLGLGQAVEWITIIPAALDRSADSSVEKLQALGKALDVQPGEAAALLAVLPQLYSITSVSIIKDKFDSLAIRLGLPTSAAVSLIMRQGIIWVISPKHIKSSIPRICERLGLTTEEAIELVARVPVVLALEEGLLNMQVGALAGTLGVPVLMIIELLSKCLGLAAVPAEVLGANLTNLASFLHVSVEVALDLVIFQPTMLAAQLSTISAGLDAVQEGLQLNSRAQGLLILAQQPSLLYDYTATTINDRLESLATVFQVPVSSVREMAAVQPMLLTVAPFTMKTALGVAMSESGDSITPQQCLEIMVNEPASFMSLAISDDTLDTWTSRLGLEEEQAQDLLDTQPVLIETAANTVKARLESLAALFDVSTGIAAQLVQRNAPLAAIPPNVIITRVKNLSLALGVSMQSVSQMVAKAPALLSCAIAEPGEVNKDMKPHVALIQEIVAAYEFYTMEWLQRSVKEVAPRSMRSFATLDTR